MHVKRYFLVAFTAFAFSAAAQKEVSDDFFVHFPVSQGKLSMKFADNSEEINDILKFFNIADSSDTIKLKEVKFFSSASPEGNYNLNLRLAQTRRDSLVKYILQKVSIPDNIIKYSEDYIDWNLLVKELKKSNVSSMFRFCMPPFPNQS